MKQPHILFNKHNMWSNLLRYSTWCLRFPAFVSLQYIYSIQWDCEYLEPPSGFSPFFFSWGQWPLLSTTSRWSKQRRLRHLRYRALLLPGNSCCSLLLQLIFCLFFFSENFLCPSLVSWFIVFFFNKLIHVGLLFLLQVQSAAPSQVCIDSGVTVDYKLVHNPVKSQLN